MFAAFSGWVVLGQPLDLLTLPDFAAIFVGFALLKRRALRGRLDPILP